MFLTGCIRVWPKVTRLPFLLAASTLLSGCSDAVPESSLVGTYRANYGGETTTLILKPDHTFTHTVVANGQKVEEQTSTWTVSQLESKWYKWTTVDFTKFVTTRSYRISEEIRLQRPMKAGWVSEVERSWLGRIDLCFDSDVGYCYTKQSGP
ncbi:hypothetical protein HAP47_0019125 [Bradyrhizobium sp. 41S5]|uniref:hypothetical protein n=1 Tax=Bradyrhizobium sp. 41S5 TaxID=1404443 RepID=UPI00156B3D83|nr:hypothetical protein [Bradyrhizobium sp. 41S5]UFX48654.1 hypothetical protein HAP47_0019125 [Bradyrhizobium sp. 41S5]